MNNTELIASLSKRLKLSKTEVEKRLEETTAIFTSELLNNNVISIMNFGTLEVKKRNERISIHPNTGKKILVPPKLIVKYKPSMSLNKKIKELKP